MHRGGKLRVGVFGCKNVDNSREGLPPTVIVRKGVEMGWAICGVKTTCCCAFCQKQSNIFNACKQQATEKALIRTGTASSTIQFYCLPGVYNNILCPSAQQQSDLACRQAQICNLVSVISDLISHQITVHSPNYFRRRNAAT